jgi:hypothetical protein
VHAAPRFGPSTTEIYAYPCGKPVATSNAAQDADFAAGASHGQHYWRDRITCPLCPAP